MYNLFLYGSLGYFPCLLCAKFFSWEFFSLEALNARERALKGLDSKAQGKQRAALGT